MGLWALHQGGGDCVCGRIGGLNMGGYYSQDKAVCGRIGTICGRVGGLNMRG